MCYDKYYSVIMKIKVHIEEICPVCMRKVPFCALIKTNNISTNLCRICQMYVHIFYPELFR